MNGVHRFVVEDCRENPSYSIQKRIIYDAYCIRTRALGEIPVSFKRFCFWMNQRYDTKQYNCFRVYLGITLKHAPPGINIDPAEKRRQYHRRQYRVEIDESSLQDFLNMELVDSHEDSPLTTLTTTHAQQLGPALQRSIPQLLIIPGPQETPAPTPVPAPALAPESNPPTLPVMFSPRSPELLLSGGRLLRKEPQLPSYVEIMPVRLNVRYDSAVKYTIECINSLVDPPYVPDDPRTEDDIIEYYYQHHILPRKLPNYDLEILTFEQFYELDDWFLEDIRLTSNLFQTQISRKYLDRTEKRCIMMGDIHRHIRRHHPEFVQRKPLR